MSTSFKKKVQISVTIRNEEEPRHRSSINSLAFDKSTGRMYTAGSDSVIRIWDGTTPDDDIDDQDSERFINSLEHHCDWVNDLALCDSNYLVSASSDTTIKVWNTKQSFCMSTLRTHSDYVKSLAYAKDVGLLVSASFDKKVYLWSLENLTKLSNTNNSVTATSLPGNKNSVYSVATSSTAHVVCSGSTEKVIRIWDGRTSQKTGKLKGHTDNVKDLLVSNDENQIVSASSDGTIKVWSVGQQRCIGTIKIHSEGVWTLAANESFTEIYSGGKDCKVWRTNLRDLTSSELLLEEDRSIQKIEKVKRYNLTGMNSPVIENAAQSNDIKRDKDVGDGACETHNNISSKLVNNDITQHYFHDETSLTDYTDARKFLQAPNVPADIVIRGAPSIRTHFVLNDRRHIVTKDTENNVDVWDVLQGRKVASYGKKSMSEVTSKYYKKVFVPSWFSVDLKLGMLQIVLEEGDIFAAWVSAKEAGFSDRPPETKVNYGAIFLKSLFEEWPNSYGKNGDVRDEAESFQTYSPYKLPSYIPIILSESYGKPIFKCSINEIANDVEREFLADFLPPWASDFIERNQFPKFNKIPFILIPYVPNTGNHHTSANKTPKKERLSSTEMLQMRKVMEHVIDKIISPNEGGNSQNHHANNGQINPTNQTTIVHSANLVRTPILNPETKIELYCCDQKLDPEMDLRTVKHFIWKQGADLAIQYKILK
uniref:WD repeat-containing protein 48 homolog n=1 Tax=Rhabditophanes sp. KR3021 TaxID=114890 RepID=A0AC35U3C7_9BILA